jgi:hypothetical protein
MTHRPARTILADLVNEIMADAPSDAYRRVPERDSVHRCETLPTY